MKYHTLPLFVWAIFVTAILLLLALPVLAGIFIVLALNLAVCWKYFTIIIIKSKLAGNLIYLYKLGILREYTPEIICCKNSKLSLNKNHLTKVNNISSLQAPNVANSSNDFINYLTGLIEGDGTIIVPKTERSFKGKINYPSIQIVFNLKDFPLALLIQKNLGYGSLQRKKGVNAYVLYINNQKGILNLVNLLNGNMRTPKIYSLFNLIDWLNKKNPELTLKKLPLKSLDPDLLGEDAWLSGIIESDGHFSVRSTIPQDKKNKYPKIECKFEFSQRERDHLGNSNELFMSSIAKFLNTSLKNIRENTSNPQFRLRTTNLESNLKLINYLNKYPLFGTKFLDYNDWKEVLNLFNPRFKYSEANIERVLQLKSEMNDRRTKFI